MTLRLKTCIAVLALTALASGCAKKSKSSRPAGRPAAAAPAQTVDLEGQPAKNSVPEDNVDRPQEQSSRFSEAELNRFSDEGRARVRVRTAPGEEVADASEAERRQIADDVPTEDVETQAAPPVEGRSDQCGTAFGHDSQQWAPGLPNPPSTVRICTGGSNRKQEPGDRFVCEGSRDLVYTDARQDGIMAMTVDLVNRLPRHMDLGSRELARRIRGVKIDFGASVRAKLKLQVSNDEIEEVDFRGSPRSGRSQAIPMLATDTPRGLRFSAFMACADADGGCSNAILRVQQLSRSGRVARVAYVTLRSGEAHVTMTEQDRKGFRSITNPGHAEFAQYLSNTAYNTCVSILRDTINGDRQLPTCAYNRLKNICGRKAQFKRPAAQSFEFNSWAVAYGEAGFEIEMIDRGALRFRVQGPLVAGPSTPVLKEALRVTGAFGSSIQHAALVANDGGGNLNLQIDFKGEASTRISVTTLIEDVRYSSEAVMARARQMPALSEREMVTEQELREVTQRRAEFRAQREVAPAAPRAANAPRPPAPVPAPAARRAAPAAPRAANAPRPPAPIPGAPPAATPPAGRPNVATRPLPANPVAAPKPAAPSGPRLEAPTGGVAAREEDDNEVIQPREP